MIHLQVKTFILLLFIILNFKFPKCPQVLNPGRTLPIELMLGDPWVTQTGKQYCFKLHQLSTVSLVMGSGKFMSGIVGGNEWLARWCLSEGVDSLDNWDCFLGVNERCSRNGLHLNRTEADRFTVMKVTT